MKPGFVTAGGCRDITALKVGKDAGMSHSVLSCQDGLRGIYTSHFNSTCFLSPYLSLQLTIKDGAGSDLMNKPSPSITNITVRMDITT